MRTEEEEVSFFSQICNVNFQTYETPPCIYQVNDIKKTKDNLGKANPSIHLSTTKSKLQSSNVFRFF